MFDCRRLFPRRSIVYFLIDFAYIIIAVNCVSSGMVLGILPIFFVFNLPADIKNKKYAWTTVKLLILAAIIFYAYKNQLRIFVFSHLFIAEISLLTVFFVNLLLRVKPQKNRQQRVCMLVTSGVFNDSRVLREARTAAEHGFDTLIIGRQAAEPGKIDPDWQFNVKLIPIRRADGQKLLTKIYERVSIGIVLFRNAVNFAPDVIHCNDFDTLPFGFMAAYVRECGLVYDSHELWSEQPNVLSSKIGKTAVTSLEKFFAKRCDSVISVSNAGAAWFREKYKLNNVSVVTNCPYAVKSEQVKKNEGFELLSHGTLAPYRGYEEMIACAKLVEGDGISVCIRGFGEELEKYRQMIKDENQKNLHLLPKISPFEVVAAAMRSHVGVVLTRPVALCFSLTVSNKLFECINAGLPVILSDVAEHRYLNDKYIFGLILDEMTPELLAQAAIKLKNDTELYNRLRENALTAAKELCWDIEGLKLINIYKTIVQKTEG